MFMYEVPLGFFLLYIPGLRHKTVMVWQQRLLR